MLTKVHAIQGMRKVESFRLPQPINRPIDLLEPVGTTTTCTFLYIPFVLGFYVPFMTIQNLCLLLLCDELVASSQPKFTNTKERPNTEGETRTNKIVSVDNERQSSVDGIQVLARIGRSSVIFILLAGALTGRDRPTDLSNHSSLSPTPSLCFTPRRREVTISAMHTGKFQGCFDLWLCNWLLLA